MKNIILTILLFVSYAGYTQTGSSSIVYPDDKLPGNTPQKFAYQLISTDAHEFSCSFTPDGKEFYFTRMDADKRKNQIMFIKYADGKWTRPAVVDFIDGRMAFEPRVSADGNKLFFTWEKALPEQQGPPMNIWYVERGDNGWSDPRNPGAVFNPMKTMYISTTSSGRIYTSDVSGGPGNEAVAMIDFKNGQYQEMERLPQPINTGKQDMYPYITPDESILLFTSRRERQDRNTDIFVSFRNEDGSWSEPSKVELGMPAGLPLISPDGRFLFFTAGERGKSDIYWVDASIVYEMKN
jgi:Tol biopolymer transport system component